MESDDDDVLYQYSVYGFLAITILIYTSSLISLIIHFYKFFHSPKPQSLATKNLTFYCFFVFLFYLYVPTMWDVIPWPEFEFDSSFHFPSSFIFFYLILQTTFLKFIIALDIFFSFRRIAKYLQRSSGPQNKKLFVYWFGGTIIPILCATSLLFITGTNMLLLDNESEDLLVLVRMVRIARLIPVLGAFWYIRSASIDKTELWTNFGLHMRLLIMLGGFSAVISLTELFVSSNAVIGILGNMNVQVFYFYIHCAGIFLEGVLIVALFTFRKDTFKSVSSGASSSG